MGENESKARNFEQQAKLATAAVQRHPLLATIGAGQPVTSLCNLLMNAAALLREQGAEIDRLRAGR